MSAKALKALLGDRIVGYHPVLARIAGGAAEGVLLSQLLYWDSKMEAARGRTWDGWFWKVAGEIYEETGMTRVEFETARANLIKRGLVEYEARGVPKRAHYRMNLDALTAALESADEFAKAHARKIPPKQDPTDSGYEYTEPQDTDALVENRHVENQQEVMSKMGAPVCRESANQNVESRQTIQEITSLDSQKIPVPEGEAHFSIETRAAVLRGCLRDNFYIPSDDSLDWVQTLCAAIPDHTFLIDYTVRARAGQSHAILDQPTFTRYAKFQYARLQASRKQSAHETDEA